VRTDVEIKWDVRTVWVNGPQGAIGRFSVHGIDVHTADATGCLDCAPGPCGAAEWDRFVAGMREHHGVEVPSEARPLYLGD
jgi:hypothetical protein